MSETSDEHDGYLVKIKPSARKSTAPVGKWVNRHGSTRRFSSKPLAREWARVCTCPGTLLWIQDVIPWDESEADGYLVGGSRRQNREAVPGIQTTFEE